MRAKNEFRNIAETYNTKLILERVVDGKLMCPEACCGAPIMECKCGPDCEHCNCHEIQKLAKEDKTIKEFYKMRDPDGDGSWPDDEDDRSEDPHYGEPEYQDTDGEYGEDNEDPYTTLDATVRDFEQELDIRGDGIDTNVNELKDYVDIIKTLDIDERQRKSALKYLMNLRGPEGRVGLEDVDYNFVFGEEKVEDNEKRDKNREFADSLWSKDPEDLARSKRAAERVLGKRRVARPPHLFTKGEDNEEPKRGITGLNPRRSPELHSMKSHAIDEIDLSKWKDYPAEDVMKAVYRQYGQELPSVDSYDWAITWDKKVRPWLKTKFPQEDNEQPVDSLYIKDSEELKKALLWHHGNYAKLRQKSMRGDELTDDEYDSLKHSEGELDLHDQLER